MSLGAAAGASSLTPSSPLHRDTPEQAAAAGFPLPGTPKNSSLPRQKRRGDLPPSPNVAIVSPMPALQLQRPREGGEEEKKSASREESEDPMQGIAPMAPLGLFRSGRGPERRGASETSVNTAALLTGKGTKGCLPLGGST